MWMVSSVCWLLWLCTSLPRQSQRNIITEEECLRKIKTPEATSQQHRRALSIHLLNKEPFNLKEFIGYFEVELFMRRSVDLKCY